MALVPTDIRGCCCVEVNLLTASHRTGHFLHGLNLLLLHLLSKSCKGLHVELHTTFVVAIGAIASRYIGVLELLRSPLWLHFVVGV